MDGSAESGSKAAPAPSVTLAPAGAGWSALVQAQAAVARATPDAGRFRGELGLPADRPVVMSGHQAQWWHAGILAKQIALAAVCRQAGAAAGWVVVDQDASDSLTLKFPAVSAGAQMPSRQLWAIAPAPLADQVRADVALHDLPPFAPGSVPTQAATPDVARGLRAIADSAARWSHARNAAEQIARANAELVSAALGPASQQTSLVFSTSLLQTASGRLLLERMVDDPGACVAAYNRAVAASGVRTIAPLSFVPEKNRYELPLWQLSGKERPTPRRRVFAGTIGDAPLESLAPRGVLMTALLRWLGCDLFIHGTGGGATGEEGGYDKVAEHWFRDWLGVELAPSVTATATVLLPMGVAPTASEDDLRAAHRRIENARHAPRTLGDAHAQAEKDRLVGAISASRERTERHRLYRQMHQGLDLYRTAHADAVRAAVETAARTENELAAQSVLRERTWPWPLLPRTMVLDLQRRVAAQLGTPEA